MSGSIVTFSYADWSALFPFLAQSVNSSQAQLYFNLATLYVDNSPCGAIQDPVALEAILNLTTAHCAQLFGSINGQDPSTLVGRLSSATKGSVSVSTELNVSQNAAWWAQTPQGYAAWQAMSPYRTAHYVPAPQRGYGYGYGYGRYRGF